ncbi:MAG: Rrf2 family transcriptional regulator [Methylacidiphilales bacterium]|nr:Rrf2 family transcriptional regulator [Candidatus Methylacidiphilales bacterium]
MPASCQFATGVHLLALLAQSPAAFRTSNEIAESTMTHPVVVRRLMASLQEAGMAETQKGPGGGVRLSRLPRQITLADVYRAVKTSEPLHLPHTPPNKKCPIGQAMHRILEDIFTGAEEAMIRELARTTLNDVLENAMHPSSSACIPRVT